MDVLARGAMPFSDLGEPHSDTHHAHAAQDSTLSADVSLIISTAVAVGICVALCVAESLFSVNAEEVVCLLLFALGYVVIPIAACGLFIKGSSTRLRLSPMPLSQLSSHLAWWLAPTSSSILAAVNACTTVSVLQAGESSRCGENHQCTVCLEDVLEGASARALPCAHVFHSSCADAWLVSARRNCCPLCLRAVCPDRDENMLPVPQPSNIDSSETDSCTTGLAD
jgi:Ring finger domain